MPLSKKVSILQSVYTLIRTYQIRMLEKRGFTFLKASVKIELLFETGKSEPGNIFKQKKRIMIEKKKI